MQLVATDLPPTQLEPTQLVTTRFVPTQLALTQLAPAPIAPTQTVRNADRDEAQAPELRRNWRLSQRQITHSDEIGFGANSGRFA